MDWVKLATRYYTDPKVRGLDDAAELMFVRGLARAGELGDGGFIPAGDVPLLTRRRRYGALVDAVVANGLWTHADGGYQIAAWSDWQDALDALTKRRTADRDRKRKQRSADRESFLAQHGDQCRRCGSTENIVIDHIVPRSRGGSDTDDNKQPLCWSCNSDKRNMTEAEYDAYLVTLVDSGYLSADKLKFVRTQREREDKELGGSSLGETHYRARADLEPPQKCTKHMKIKTPPNCGSCADARKDHARWEAERAKRLASAPKCRLHRGQPADNCAQCLGERKAAP